MKSLILAFFAAATSSAFAAPRTSSSGGGDWYSPSAWDGGIPPVAGDSATIVGSAKMTVSSGEVVTNTFIYLNRDALGGAELDIGSGACVTNCRVRFGVTSGTPAEGAVSRVVLEDGGSFVMPMTEFMTYPGNEFVQKGGLVHSDINESHSPQALYDQQGGTNSAAWVQIASATFNPETFVSYHLHRGARLDVENFMVSGGTAIMEGDWNTASDLGNRGKTQFFAGCANGSFGRLLFRGVTNKLDGLFIGTNKSAARQNPTGVVDFVDAEIVISSSPAIATSNGQNGRGVMRLDNSRIQAYANTALLDASAMTDPNGRTASLVVSGNSNFAVISEAFSYNPWTCSDDEFFSWQSESRGFSVYPGSDICIEGGTMRVSDRIFFAGGKVRIGQGGKLACYRFYSTAPTTQKTVGSGEIVIEDGGELYVKQGDFCFGQPNNASMNSYVCDQTLRMKGGSMTLPTGYVKLGAAGNTTRLEVSGGTLPSNAVLQYWAPGSVEVSFKGSSYTADISGVGTNKTSGFTSDDVLLEFVLDKSPQHIRAVNMSGSNGGGTWTPRRCGNLRVKLDGGILFTDRDEFALLTTSHKNSTFDAYGGAGDFVSLPDATLWEEVLSSNARTCSVRLASTELATSWENGSVVLPEAMPMGSIQLSGISTAHMGELKVSMSVAAADGSALGADALASLRDGLVAAGYTNSTCSAGSQYNLTAAVPADVIGDGDRRFVWDFTETKGIKTVDTVVTNAVLSAVSFKAKPRYKGFKIIFR